MYSNKPVSDQTRPLKRFGNDLINKQQMILDDYIAYCETYKQLYGNLTAILMQVGDFFELYAIVNDHEQAGADIYRIADLCNLQISRKNKSNIECNRQNPLMAGFPMYILQKHVQTLVSANYTCVIIRQVSPPPNVVRKVTEVVSPATFMSPVGFDAPFLMVLYWTSLGTSKFGDVILGVGMCWIDLTTGECGVYEVGSHTTDLMYAKDEAYRMLKTLRPKEVVCCMDSSLAVSQKRAKIHDDILDHLQIPDSVCMHIKYGEEVTPFTSPSYQKDILEKVYADQNKTLLPIVEYLGITFLSMVCTSLCVGIQFAFSHNEDILKNLKPCVIHNSKNKLQLQYNSALQLNVISYNPTERPLSDILNRCATAFGKRRFMHYLLNPSSDPQWLCARYQAVHELLENDLFAMVTRKLAGVLDLERTIRRIALATMPPCDWNGLHSSLESSKDAFSMLESNSIAIEILSKIRSIQEEYLSILDLEEAGKYLLSDITGSIFVRGVCTKIDAMHDLIRQDQKVFVDVAECITAMGGDGPSTLCRFECNDRDGYFLLMTATRWKQVTTRAQKRDIVVGGYTYALGDFDVRSISSQSSVLRISHPHLRDLSTGIFEKQRILSNLVQERYKEFLRDFFDRTNKLFESVIYEIGELDVHATNAKNAREFSYCKPVINCDKDRSYVDAGGLRHPIIERVSHETLYVTNDVCLGTEGGLKGMLLYGVNSSGKSSLMKAVGLSIIMAQAGMYVPASTYEFLPFKQLFTRISGSDNIYRGMSTFVVEMTELRNILLRCDAQSIVLGDELCAGTESTSAVSIVGAGIDYMAKSNAVFIFATHLHELQNVMDLPSGVENYYMHVEFDSNKKIKYDRLLKKGIGSRYYGLEVCHGIDMPGEFLKHANEIRKRVLGVGDVVVENKISRYNSNVRMDTCRICGEKATEVHHIKYQCTADKNGFIDHHSMNHAANLVPLCDSCHTEEHHGEMKIHGYIQTNQGTELKVTRKSVVEDRKSKDVKGILKYTPRGWVARKNKRCRWKPVSEADALSMIQITEEEVDRWKTYLNDPLH